MTNYIGAYIVMAAWVLWLTLLGGFGLNSIYSAAATITVAIITLIYLYTERRRELEAGQ